MNNEKADVFCAHCDDKIYQVTDPNNLHWYHARSGDVHCSPRFATPRVSANVVAPTVEQKPIDMILFCPRCGTQHVDSEQSETDFRHLMEAWSLNAEPQDHVPTRWTNPPHKSHLCHQCGAVWRPADVPTNGVAQIKTRGKRDNTWTNSVAVPAASPLAATQEEAGHDLDPLEFWCDLAEVLGHPRPAKADIPALVSEVKDRLAAKPSGAARDAAEEIVKYFRDLASYGNIREPDEDLLIAKVLEMLSGVVGGEICKSHGLAVLVTHVNDGEPCSDYLHTEPAPTTGERSGVMYGAVILTDCQASVKPIVQQSNQEGVEGISI